MALSGLNPAAALSQWTSASALRSDVQIQGAPEIDFRSLDLAKNNPYKTPARIIPVSPSYFTTTPVFNDYVLQLEHLLKSFGSMPVVRAEEAPQMPWMSLEQARTAMGENIGAAKFAQVLGMLRRLNVIHPNYKSEKITRFIELFRRPGAKPVDPRRPVFTDEFGRSTGVGRRKSAAAKAVLVEGIGEVLINGKSIIDTFPRLHDRESALWALKISNRLDKYNAFILTSGGGTTGQAESVTLAVAKALLVQEPALKSVLRKAGCLTRVLKRVERKKAGRVKARQGLGPPTTDRFAIPLTPVRSEPTRQSMTRPYLSSYSQYGYQDPQYGSSSIRDSSTMQGVELQYSPSYVQHVSRQQTVAQDQPAQPYAQYGPGTILPSMHQQTMYDQVPAYQQRQSSAIEAMSSQLGGLPQYLPQPEQQNLQLQTGPSHYAASQADSSAYPSAALQRAPLQSQYGSAGYREYEQQLRATLEAIIAGRLTEAGEKILPLSRWLTNSVVPLGLHHDDESQYVDRMNLWRAFNLCWEALGQKQKDVCEDALRTGRVPGDILAAGTIHRMVDELLSLCDQLEQYGLVDYEMGVAEEEITHIFTVCLDLLQRPEFGSIRPSTN
ncbi:hypothetical protein DV736_g2738, partial [Chaetothyriales sp. CBS 134916]